MGLLRLLLALSVVLAHSGPFPLTGNQFVGGVVAVQSFYIISGFYMALILTSRYGSVREFMYNRFIRLFPLYWIVLLLAFLADPVSNWLLRIVSSTTIGLDAKLFMLAANLLLLGSDLMMFLAPTADGLRFTVDFNANANKLYTYHAIPQAWSLPIEICFYAIAPWLVRSKLRLVIVLLAALALRVAIYWWISDQDPWTYRFFPAELAFFCAGSLGFHFYKRVSTWELSFWVGIGFLVAIVIMTVFLGPRRTEWVHSGLLSGRRVA